MQKKRKAVAFVLAHSDIVKALDHRYFASRTNMVQLHCGQCGGHTVTSSSLSKPHCGHCGSSSLKKQVTANSSDVQKVKTRMTQIAGLNGSNLSVTSCSSCGAHNQRDLQSVKASVAHCVSCGDKLTEKVQASAESDQMEYHTPEMKDATHVENDLKSVTTADSDAISDMVMDELSSLVDMNLDESQDDAILADLHGDDDDPETAAKAKAKDCDDESETAALSEKQKKIDLNKNGKIDAEDLKNLRNGKSTQKSGKDDEEEDAKEFKENSAYDEQAFEGEGFGTFVDADADVDEQLDNYSGDAGSSVSGKAAVEDIDVDKISDTSPIDNTPFVDPDGELSASCEMSMDYDGEDSVALADDLGLSDDLNGFEMATVGSSLVAFKGNVAIASMNASDLTVKNLSARTVKRTIELLARKGGLRDALNSQGFAPIAIKARQSVGVEYSTKVAESLRASLTTEFDQKREAFVSSLALAASALATGALENATNPIQTGVQRILASRGYHDADVEATKLAMNEGVEFAKKLISAAVQISDMKSEDREVLAKAVKMVTNQVTASFNGKRSQNMAMDDDAVMDRMSMSSLVQANTQTQTVRNRVVLPC